MSTLKDRLDKIREGFKKQAPAEALAVMASAEGTLRASGIMERIVTVGSPLPAFTLPDTEGNQVESASLLARGPLVVTHYRGVW